MVSPHTDCTFLSLVTMNRLKTVHVAAAVCGLLAAITLVGAPAAYPSSSGAAEASSLFMESPATPKPILDLMREATARYLEGSNLIKAGNSDGARKAFNHAVDLILKSEWDIKTTPVLDRFFEDLISRIADDESQYLLVASEIAEETESAVVDELDELDLIPIQINTSLQHDLVSDLAKTKYEIPITINDMVLKSLNFWLNSGRKHFVDGLIRSGKYLSIIEKVFQEGSIPLDLMYLAQVESLSRPTLIRKPGPRDMAVWRSHAKRYGLKVTRSGRAFGSQNRHGLRTISQDLFAMFKDWNLVLAAYNWGERRVQRLIKTTGLKDFWQLIDLNRKVPKETRNHVPLIQASVILARNPEKYGLPTKLDPPLRYHEVSVSKPIDLRMAAKVLGTSVDELKKLNPALRGSTTPANYPDFRLKVPIDTDSEQHEKLASLPAVKVRFTADASGRYRIRRGDTLSGIAARHGVTVAELCRENNLTPRSKIIAGKWLQIPSRQSSSSRRATAGSGRKANS